MNPAIEQLECESMRICAPFAGTVRYHVPNGSTVGKGQRVASIEATKVETNITAPTGGTVTLIAEDFSHVVGGDSIFAINK